MPYIQQHVLMGIHGVFGTTAALPVEQWVTTLRIAHGSPGPTDFAVAGFLGACVAPVKAFHTGSGSLASTFCWFTHLTGARIDFDGKYIGGAEQNTTVVDANPAVSGPGTMNLPITTALVRSLRTGKSRGPGSNGRMYYPCLGANVTAAEQGRLAAATALTCATAFATMLGAIGAAAEASFSTPAFPAVESKVGSGHEEQIFQVRVGRRLDHMESREKNLAEDWQIATVPEF